MFSSKTTLAIITMLVMSSINVGYSMYSESSSETETPYITSDEVYKCLSNPFFFTSTNWNDSITVDNLKCQLKKEFSDYYYTLANAEFRVFTHTEGEKADALVNSFLHSKNCTQNTPIEKK